MTTYQVPAKDWFATQFSALMRRVSSLETRTQNIDSGTLLQTLTGTIDPAYSGVGNPNVQITGAASVTGPYSYLSGYVPSANDSVLLVPSGSTYVIAGLVHPTTTRNQLSASTTVQNTASETVIASLTIPANDAVVGATWQITAWGVASVTATPTITLRSRIGGLSGVQLASSGARTASSGITGHTWRTETYLVCLSTGSSGTWFGQQVATEAISVAGSAPFVPAVIQDGTVSATADTTISETLVVTAAWSAASASNSLTCEGYIAQRVA